MNEFKIDLEFKSHPKWTAILSDEWGEELYNGETHFFEIEFVHQDDLEEGLQYKNYQCIYYKLEGSDGYLYYDQTDTLEEAIQASNEYANKLFAKRSNNE